jgi:hypothetical protein
MRVIQGSGEGGERKRTSAHRRVAGLPNLVRRQSGGVEGRDRAAGDRAPNGTRRTQAGGGFASWAIVELKDRRRIGGYVTEHPIAGAAFVRLEVLGPDGEIAVTHFYPPSALFCITPASRELARAAALADEPQPVPIERIKQVVADYYHVSPTELAGNRRERGICGPRQVAMYLARELTGHSLPTIGRAFGARHHTTALRSIDKVGRQLGRDPNLRRQLESVRAWLGVNQPAATPC